ncbi:hypothetical protein B0O40_1281 [Ruminococcaceae bacterium R-25]|nr:hypothetical protein B0O40_1281 [Ruminococcaceae bacterium R-25]SUQ11891.1 hypothetical protein SAMN06297423_1281 [Oscillospiraceae bacterium]
MLFEWDENKNKVNIKKHGIGFAEASSVFYDENAILFDDPDHSKDEERFLIIGMSIRTQVLTVSHCYRSKGEVIRIISARKATKSEADYYVQGGGEL